MKIKTKLIFVFCILIFKIAYADPLTTGDNFLRLGEYITAKEFFKKYTEDPNLADRALLGLGKSEYFLGNYYEATVSLKRILRDFKNSPTINEANFYLGLSYLKIGRLKEAEEHLKKVGSPLDKQAMIGYGWIALYKGDLKSVETVLNKLDKKDFNEPDTALLRIKYLVKAGKPEEALKEFNRNLKLRKPIYDIDKAEILIKVNKFSEAETVLKKFIDTSERLFDTLKAKRMLFEAYLAQNKTNEALKIGKEIYYYVPTDDIRLKIYSIYMNQKNYDEAIRMIFVLRDKEIKNKKFEEFIKTVMQDSPEKATQYIVKIYPFLPSDSSLLLNLANFLISHGKYDEAKNVLRKIQTGPRKSEAIIPYAKILINEGRYKEAKKILESIKDRNDLAKALYAQVLDKEGDKLTALFYLRKISKSIKDPEILVLIGDLEYSNGDRKKAIQYWINASKYGSAEATLKAADYFYLSKKTKEAIEYYKKAIDLGIKDNDSLMWAYYQYGKLTKDKKYLEKVANSKGKLSEAAKSLLETL
ncbi:MAG: tetratricopeptide repeat protein [Thermodesulfovibrio sp.]